MCCNVCDHFQHRVQKEEVAHPPPHTHTHVLIRYYLYSEDGVNLLMCVEMCVGGERERGTPRDKDKTRGVGGGDREGGGGGVLMDLEREPQRRILSSGPY